METLWVEGASIIDQLECLNEDLFSIQFGHHHQHPQYLYNVRLAKLLANTVQDVLFIKDFIHSRSNFHD